MMGGFNALRAMNDAIKQNRDNLRKKKNSPFGKDRLKEMLGRPRSGEPLEGSSTLSDEETTALIQKNRKENYKESIKTLIVLTVSVVITIFLVIALLNWIA